MAKKKGTTSIQHPQNSTTTTVMVTADGRSHIEGRLVMALCCAYATCGDMTIDGIVVRFANSVGLPAVSPSSAGQPRKIDDRKTATVMAALVVPASSSTRR
jgi:hypothetical protein